MSAIGGVGCVRACVRVTSIGHDDTQSGTLQMGHGQNHHVVLDILATCVQASAYVLVAFSCGLAALRGLQWLAEVRGASATFCSRRLCEVSERRDATRLCGSCRRACRRLVHTFSDSPHRGAPSMQDIHHSHSSSHTDGIAAMDVHGCERQLGVMAPVGQG